MAAYALLGKRDYVTAEQYLRRCVELSHRAPWPTDRASFYRWMRRGIEARDAFVLSMNREFLWEPARNDEEFKELTRLVGLA